jgi:hypothetical protein
MVRRLAAREAALELGELEGYRHGATVRAGWRPGDRVESGQKRALLTLIQAVALPTRRVTSEAGENAIGVVERPAAGPESRAEGARRLELVR